MTWAQGTNILREQPRMLHDFGAPQVVSTETPLLALTTLGDVYKALAFTLRNHDATNIAAFYVEQSESGIVSEEARQTFLVSPLKERTFEFRDVMRLMWGVTAAGNPDAGYPSVSVSWRVIGLLR